MNILFITPRIPASTIRGDQLRTFYQIQSLAKKHSIFVITFEARQPGPENPEELSPYCERIITVRRPLKEIVFSTAGSFFNHHPYQVNFYKSPAIGSAIQEMLSGTEINIIHIQLARMAECRHFCANIPKVIDLVDSLALNLWNRHLYDTGLKSAAAYWEYSRMQQYEQTLAAEFDRVITISERDHQAVGSPLNGVVIPNGVNLQAFPYSSMVRNPWELVFAGNMGYFPNVDGIQWFTREILPLIRQIIPHVRLLIVGANPTKDILRLSHLPGIEVTGWVPDISYYLQRASAAICPIRAGSGMQNKVLEAMASGCPIVLTSQVIAGLSYRPSDEVLIADQPEHFAQQVVRLLSNQTLAKSLARSARNFVAANYSWSSINAALEDTYYQVCETHRQRA